MARGYMQGLGVAALLLSVSAMDALRDTGFGAGNYWRYHLPKWAAFYGPLVYILWSRWPLWVRCNTRHCARYRRARLWHVVIWTLLAAGGVVAWRLGAILGGQPTWGGIGGLF